MAKRDRGNHNNGDDDAEFIEHLPCEECGSSDANAYYSDGHCYCFSCGAYTPPGDESIPRDIESKKQKRSNTNTKLIPGEYKDLGKRGITKDTARIFGYQVGTYNNKPVQIANYADDDGNIVAQKLRFANKQFKYLGDPDKAKLFGQNVWPKGQRMVVVTEGEIDAMSVSQVQGNQYPVVSIPTGAKGAKKALNRHMSWLMSFDSIVLMFDQDEDGQNAIDEVAPLFPPKKVFVAGLPDNKDPNDLLVEDRGKELYNSIWRARVWRPGEIVTVHDIKDEVRKPVEWGLSWPWNSLTKHTYGRRRGEVYTIGAGTGVGKTDVVSEIIAHNLEDHQQPTGAIFLEQTPKETVQRVAGKIAGHKFHVPDANWTQRELDEALDWLEEQDTLQLYGGWSGDWEDLEEVIRYWAAEGIKDVVVDHLTAIISDAEDQRRELESTMKAISQMAVQLGITIYLVSHLSTPDGTPHEEGGRVQLKHFFGSRSIGFWSFFAFGLERNQQAEDQSQRNTTYLRILKDRYTGQSTGEIVPLQYDHEDGRIYEGHIDNAEEYFPDSDGDDDDDDEGETRPTDAKDTHDF